MAKNVPDNISRQDVLDAIALCPNCHHGQDRIAIAAKLKEAAAKRA